MALTLRNVKGSELTWNEVDGNFSYLDNKINNNALSNATVLSNFTEVAGEVFYNGTSLVDTSVGTIAEFEAALLA